MAEDQATWHPPNTGHFGISIVAAANDDQVRLAKDTSLDELGVFSECRGLAVEVTVHRFEVGGENVAPMQRPGRMTWPNVVLKRGITKSDELFNWFHATAGEGYEKLGSLSTRDVTVTLYDEAGKAVRSWTLRDAFPVKWTGPSLAAGASEAATEELEIAHHGFRPGGER